MKEYHWNVHDALRDGEYFIFVEGVTSVALEGLLRPDGEPLSQETELGKRPWRFRSSGVQARKFLQVMDRFEPLDHDNVSDNQRERRRHLLIEEFGGAPLPVFDLYADEEYEDFPFLRASFSAGSWYWIGVYLRDEGDPRLPIFVGAPELPPSPYLPGSLGFFEAVPPFIEYRLRDIFSLAHVPDAGLEETGGEAAPPPDKPHDKPDEADYSPRPWTSDYDQGTASQGSEA